MAIFTKHVCTGVMATLLTAAPALAQQQGWADWDGDADGALTAEEFSQGLAARMNFAAFDTDGDGKLSRDELGGWFYGRYDRDTSEALEATELAGIERDFGAEGLWRPDAVAGAEIVDSEGAASESADVVPPSEAVDLNIAALPDWDIDGDGLIVAHEFIDGFADWGTFDELDANGDGGITEDELGQGIFSRYDEDGNGLIAEPELADIGDDMGDGGFWDA